MNGRVYDPQLGRFLSADPFVQFALSSQGYNRYTYANNNPLSFTDPSGYFFKSVFRKVKRLVKKVFKSKVVRIAAAAAFAAYGGPAGASLLGFAKGSVGASVIGGFGAGLIASGGDLKAAIIGGLSGGALGFSGCFTACSGTSGLSMTELIVRGVVDRMFSSRSRSTEAHSGNVQTAQAQTVAATSLGGTVSAVGGTKFANGAITQAFQYVVGEFKRDSYNQKLPDIPISDIERAFRKHPSVFWTLRVGAGDPIAGLSLEVANGDSFVANTLLDYYGPKNLDLDQLRIDLVEAHIEATDSSYNAGRGGRLTQREITEYHHRVFRRYKLPPEAYGGTIFGIEIPYCLKCP